jgi:transcriptional regulator with XRE-family HTH domain
MQSTLETWRRNSGKTAEDIAAALGMRRTSLYRVEQCKTWPRPETIVQIERYTEMAVTARHLVYDWIATHGESGADTDMGGAPGTDTDFEEALS